MRRYLAPRRLLIQLARATLTMSGQERIRKCKRKCRHVPHENA